MERWQRDNEGSAGKMRRKILLMSVITLVSLLLGACGNNTEGAEQYTEASENGASDTAISEDMEMAAIPQTG